MTTMIVLTTSGKRRVELIAVCHRHENRVVNVAF